MIRRPGTASLRALISLGFLGALAVWLDPMAIGQQVREVDPAWLAAALVLGTLQFLLSAERWRRTAARLDIPLGKRRALADYYVAGFANQVLPGGVVGDAGRAWRHSRTSGRPGPAVRAVILERASGQLVLLLALFATLGVTEPGARLLEVFDTPAGPGWMIVGLCVVLAAAGLFVASRGGRMRGWLASLRQDAHRALLTRGAWPGQLALSLAVLATYCGMFACAGRMIGAEAPAATLILIAPVVLLTMLLPISVAGWGVRETAAAGVWVALGWPAAEGVAVSVAYGALCLLTSLPGAAISALRPVRRAERAS
ncbi:MAG TPA: lysylphosphatidylglycerol synthase transmembrane domain-containing protein [Wenzhouxiangellaceae bacterium]|nr:lysylphosphatidylglycerol synthase transmembrane domain-containing protein [Wenzhouxiangellaceae bacterium]